jgi:hypothetical protein
MLDFLSPAKLASNAIPAHLTTLSVSWLNNQFSAVAVHRGVVEASWEHPGEIDGTSNFESLIREAVRQTGYRGQTVSLLLAHPRLVQQLIDVPPVKAAALKKVIQRQAQQQKMFAGEAVWACQTSLSGKGAQRVVLHLFPKLLLDQLVQACHRAGLHLTTVSPPSAVLHHQMMQLGLDKEEVALLAAETGGSTTVVMGRGDGQILLARTLPGTLKEGAERLMVDLNRTILFINQQYGVATKGLWLFGPIADEQARLVQDQIQLPVKVSPIDYDPLYWASEALKLRPARSPNFISLVLQQAPRRRAFATVVAVGTALLVLGCIAASGYMAFQARQEASNIEVLRKRSAHLQAEFQELKKRNLELASKEQMVKMVIDERPAPVPVWLLGYLSEAVPSELVVTNLHLRREDRLWKLRLAGTAQTQTRPPTAASFSNSVALLNSRLANGPFHVTLVSNSDKDAAARARTVSAESSSSLPSWLTKPQPPGTPSLKPATDTGFLIEGVMQ